MRITRNDVIQTGKYLFAGGSAAIVELGVFWLLSSLNWSIALSNVSAVSLSTVYNYIFNRNVTFKSTSNSLRSGLLYLLLLLFNTLFSTWFISFLNSTFSLPSVFAKIVAMCCTVSWNFVLYRKVIFR